MNLAQIEALWIANGGDPRWAPLMAGIAIAESGGDPRALNPNPKTKDFSVGLWQINYYGDLYQPRTKEFGTPDQLSGSTARQARAAIKLSGDGSNGLQAWANDPVWNAWVAAGRPKHPSTAQVTKWLHQINRGTGYYQTPGVYNNGVFSGDVYSGVTISGNSPAAQEARLGTSGLPQGTLPPIGVQGTSGASQVGPTVGQCDGTHAAINILGLHFGTGCQLKALVGGLAVGGGIIVMVAGVIVLTATSNNAAAKIATTVAKRTPAGAAVSKALSGAGRATKVATKAAA